jgi:hypothetical protein
MPVSSTNEILNNVLGVHNRSLAKYLRDAAPWLRPGEGRVHDVLEQLAHDHDYVVDRIGRLIEEMNGVWDLGEYPMVFTAYHDVAFDWILHVLIDRQQKMIAYLQHCVEQLNLAPMAKALVEETVGMAKGHLELLEELKHPPKEPIAAPVLLAAHDDHAHSGHSAGHH